MAPTEENSRAQTKVGTHVKLEGEEEAEEEEEKEEEKEKEKEEEEDISEWSSNVPALQQDGTELVRVRAGAGWVDSSANDTIGMHSQLGARAHKHTVDDDNSADVEIPAIGGGRVFSRKLSKIDLEIPHSLADDLARGELTIHDVLHAKAPSDPANGPGELFWDNENPYSRMVQVLFCACVRVCVCVRVWGGYD